MNRVVGRRETADFYSETMIKNVVKRRENSDPIEAIEPTTKAIWNRKEEDVVGKTKVQKQMKASSEIGDGGEIVFISFGNQIDNEAINWMRKRINGRIRLGDGPKAFWEKGADANGQAFGESQISTDAVNYGVFTIEQIFVDTKDINSRI